MHEPSSDKDAFSVDKFCQRHSLSRAKFYSLVAEGRGPRLMRIDRRTLVTREAAAAWRKQMEQSSQGNA